MDTTACRVGLFSASLALLGFLAAGCSGSAKASGCQFNGDCPHGEVCTSGKCEAPTLPTPCTTDANCSSGQTCSGGLCSGGTNTGGMDAGGPGPTMGMACQTSTDCNNQFQECLSGQCTYNLGNCGSNGDCASLSATPVCDTGSSTCVQCQQTSDCASPYICNTVTQTCTEGSTGCSSDSDCATGESCESGTCVSTSGGCTSDSQCSSGETCQSGSCVSSSGSCTNSNCNGAACRQPDVCNPSTCACGPASTTGCSSNSDCSASTPVCDSSGTCVQCASDSDCGGSTPVCDTSANTCAQCLQDSDCTIAGDTCVSEMCTSGSTSGGTTFGASCTSSADCASDLGGSECSHGYCGCGRHGTCPNSNETCDDGICASACWQIVVCYNNCTLFCDLECGGGSSSDTSLYQSLVSCVEQACPNASETCEESAQASGGACYSALLACAEN